MCVCVYFDVHLSVAAHVCCGVLCFIIPASISAKLKFRIALNRLRGYCSCSSVSSVKYDYRYRDWVKMWFDCAVLIIFIQCYSPLTSKLTVPTCDSSWVNSFLQRIFEYLPKWCTYSTGIAGATWNCCHLGVFCVHHRTMYHVTLCKKPHG